MSGQGNTPGDGSVHSLGEPHDEDAVLFVAGTSFLRPRPKKRPRTQASFSPTAQQTEIPPLVSTQESLAIDAITTITAPPALDIDDAKAADIDVGSSGETELAVAAPRTPPCAEVPYILRVALLETYEERLREGEVMIEAGTPPEAFAWTPVLQIVRERVQEYVRDRGHSAAYTKLCTAIGRFGVLGSDAGLNDCLFPSIETPWYCDSSLHAFSRLRYLRAFCDVLLHNLHTGLRSDPRWVSKALRRARRLTTLDEADQAIRQGGHILSPAEELETMRKHFYHVFNSVTKEEIQLFLDKLPARKAGAPDTAPGAAWRLCSDLIAPVLEPLLNEKWAHGQGDEFLPLVKQAPYLGAVQTLVMRHLRGIARSLSLLLADKNQTIVMCCYTNTRGIRTVDRSNGCAHIGVKLPVQPFDRAKHSVDGLPTCAFCKHKFTRTITIPVPTTVPESSALTPTAIDVLADALTGTFPLPAQVLQVLQQDVMSQLRESFGSVVGAKRAAAPAGSLPSTAKIDDRLQKAGRQRVDQHGKGKGYLGRGRRAQPQSRPISSGGAGSDPFANGSADQEEERELLFLVAKAAVRHEDTLNILRRSTGWVFWIKAGDNSILPMLTELADQWHKVALTPASRVSLRVTLLWGILTHLKEKLQNLTEAEKAFAVQSGWLTDTHCWNYQRWNPTHQALVVDQGRTPLGMGSALESLTTLLEKVNGDTITRFAATQDIRQETRGTVTFQADISFRAPGSDELYAELVRLRGSALFQTIGTQFRPEGYNRPPLIRRIQVGTGSASDHWMQGFSSAVQRASLLMPDSQACNVFVPTPCTAFHHPPVTTTTVQAGTDSQSQILDVERDGGMVGDEDVDMEAGDSRSDGVGGDDPPQAPHAPYAIRAVSPVDTLLDSGTEGDLAEGSDGSGSDLASDSVSAHASDQASDCTCYSVLPVCDGASPAWENLWNMTAEEALLPLPLRLPSPLRLPPPLAEAPALEHLAFNNCVRGCSYLSDFMAALPLLPNQQAARRRKFKTSDGHDGYLRRSISVGAFSIGGGGLYGIQTNTTTYPWFAIWCTSLVRGATEAYAFSSCTLAFNVQSFLHRDGANATGTQNIIIPCSRWRGGQLWEAHPTGSMFVDDCTGPGRLMAIAKPFHVLCPRCPHATYPWSDGNRVILIAFHAKSTDKLSQAQRIFLRDLGFQLQGSARPEVARAKADEQVDEAEE
ncbi:Pol [Symbiodinium sp. CCMP2592]|nr:Pol [Symbiodinium sp. CCMP2592]